MPESAGHTDPPATRREPLRGCAPAPEGLLVPGSPLRLHHGGEIAGAGVAWRLHGHGHVHLPVVVALGGISAGRDVYRDRDGEAGWWHEVVGPGLAIDTNRVRVLGIDWLGGSGGSSGPRPGQRDFPSISSFDQAQLLEALRWHLGIDRFAAIIGASYGGMVALAFAQRFPAAVRHIAVIGAAHCPHPLATAWRSLQRHIVRFGLDRGDGPNAMVLARALAMVTYRTPAEFAQRFSGPPARNEEGRFEFPVESYLLRQGGKYKGRVAESYLCLSESIDLHAVDPGAITTPTTLIGFVEDQLVPIDDVRALARALAGPCSLHEPSSIYGHDAFLKENDMLRPLLADAQRVAAP